MKTRPFVQSMLMTALMTVALWAAGAGTASAQCPEGECPPPPPTCGGEGQPLCPQPPTCVEDDEEDDFCTVLAAVFTPDVNSWTFVFGDNNALKVTIPEVREAFPVTVTLFPHTQAQYQARVAGTPFANEPGSPSFCFPTLPAPAECAVYRVDGRGIPDREFYGNRVEYVAQWNFSTDPAVATLPKGNKHDLMLLRCPGDEWAGDPDTCVPFVGTFVEDIADKVLKKAEVGDDPGLGGGAPGISEYVIAFKEIRPASTKKN